MIRTVWTALNAVVATFVVGSAMIIGALLRIRTGRFYDGGARTWSAWILAASGVPVRIEGLDHVPLELPEVFVSNHQSWFDVLALAVAVPKRARFVAKKELERIPLFGSAWKAAGHISIDRQNRASAIESLDRAGRLLRQDNSSVMIFAEGTRSWDGRLQPFKKGAFMLALHARVDVIPTAVLGSHAVLPKGGWRIRRRPIVVRFGEPVAIADYAVDDRERLIETVHARVRQLLEQPAPGLPDGNVVEALPQKAADQRS